MDISCCVSHSNIFCCLQNRSHCSPISNLSLRKRQRIGPVGFSRKSVVNRDIVLKHSFAHSVFGCYDKRKIISFRSFHYGLPDSRLVCVQCQGSESMACCEDSGTLSDPNLEENGGNKLSIDAKVDMEAISEGKDMIQDTVLEELQEKLIYAAKDLEVARVQSTTFEQKAQRISEIAFTLKDKARSASNDVNLAVDSLQNIENEEDLAKETVQKATSELALAESKLQVVVEELQRESGLVETVANEKSDAISTAQNDVNACLKKLEVCQAELLQCQCKKDELVKEVDRLNEVAQKAEADAVKAEDDVSNIMLLAEQAVAVELQAAQRVDDAEIALKKAEKSLSVSNSDSEDMPRTRAIADIGVEDERESSVSEAENQFISTETDALSGDLSLESLIDNTSKDSIELFTDDAAENGSVKVSSDSAKDVEPEVEKSRSQANKQEIPKDSTIPPSTPKASLKKSSRFFPASFFSSTEEDTEFTPAPFFQGLVHFIRRQLPTVVIGFVLFGGGIVFYSNRAEKQLIPQPDMTSTSIEEVSSDAKPLIRSLEMLPKKVKKLMEMLPHQEVNEEEASLFDMLWLLLASVVFVPIFQKIPGGSPVLGYLAAGILIGPYGLSIIRNVHGTKAIAEFGVVFLLFNIGLELSVERLSSMKKYVFGLGSAQVLATAVVAATIAHYVCGLSGPAAIVIGNGLALSSTAVVLQVLQERGESTSRHGRATFSVLLFQDLAVVVLLILIPLISPNSLKGGVGVQAIINALGLAGVKAAIAISVIIAGGRLLLRPIYKQIAENQNAEIFSANTLLVVLGTSLLTARAGLSMALGAFLAGLLLAETEFSLQVESDIAPYRGLLLGLFFMTVGMSIDPKLLVPHFPAIAGTLGLLIGGKAVLVALIGKLFGISIISAIRVGLLLAPGGEFAFVAFGEAVNQSIISPHLSSLLFLVVGISMALTPWLAAGGQFIASRFELHDVRSLLPAESETDDLRGHIIICGFGRVGQIIAQLLSESLIPFVALDVRSDRVAVGRALDLPVYFGDAGSREVLHKIGAERACAAAITLDSPGANYRTVWALSKYFPNVKTFVRAHDVDHGLNLEKAGATAVVPETLEPSLQLAAAVLSQAKLPLSEIASTINEFRSRHLSELTELSEASGSSLGYGFSSMATKPKIQFPDISDDTTISEGALAI